MNHEVLLEIVHVLISSVHPGWENLWWAVGSIYGYCFGYCGLQEMTRCLDSGETGASFSIVTYGALI